MAAKKREIYARLGVQLRNSRRAKEAERKAPGSFGLYCYCILDSRAEELDGFVSEVVVLTALGRPAKERGKQADALCAVDLLERVEGGFKIVKYEEHNDTKADIEAAKDAVKKRVSKFRENDSVTRYTPVTNADVPISISLSVSGSGSSAEIPEATGGVGGVTVPSRPGWFDAACDTVEMNVAGASIDRGLSWLRYWGHRSAPESRKSMSQQDAVYWLTAVDVPEAQKVRRDEARRRESAKRFEKPPGAAEHEKRKLTPEEAKREHENFMAIMRGEKKPPRTGT